MRPRSWLVLVVASGCGFTIPNEGEMPDGPDPQDPSNPTDDTDPPPVLRQCNTADTSLRLCIDFEDTTALGADGSTNHLTATLADGIAVMPRASEQAAMLSSSSKLLIAEAPALDIPDELTMSMWMSLGDFATTMWMLDNNTQYAVSYQADGAVRCVLGSDTVDSQWPIEDDAWHHIACTYDGHELKVHIDGSVAGCRELDRNISTAGHDGLSVGANLGAGPTFSNRFIGGLDNVQVFARAWDDDEICDASGHLPCNFACGEGGGGGGGGGG